MAINQHLMLSPTLFTQLSAYATFKANFHIVYIQVRKDPKQKWHDFPYLVTETDVKEVVVKSPVDLHAPLDLTLGPSTGAENSTTHNVYTLIAHKN